MPKKISFEEFEQRLKNKFGDKFKYIDLSLIDKENFNYLDKYPIKCLIHNKIVYKEPKIFLRSTTLNICSECQREQQISDVYKLHKHNERHYTSINEFLEQLYQKFDTKITINKDDILCCVISGAGPSILVISRDNSFEKVKDDVKKVFDDLNVNCDIRTFNIENEGTKVI